MSSLPALSTPSSATPSTVAQAIEAQFIQTYLSQNRKAQIGLLLSAILIASIWTGREAVLMPMLWLGVFCIVSGLRYFFTTRLVLSGPRLARSQWVALTLLVNGVLMAIPLSAFAAFSELERLAISIILMALATGSTATTAGYKSIFMAFALPMLVPLALAWAMLKEHDPTGLSSWGIAVLVVFYLGFLISLGKQVSVVFEQSCTYRFGEQRLNEELKEALDKADESNRAKTHFLAAASHDLRQPLHSINVLVAALSMSNLDGDTRRIVDLLDTVNQAFSKQLDGLLDLSKLDAGAVAPNLARHRLDQLLRSHAQGLEPVALQKKITLVTDLRPGVEVHTDDVLLRRVLSNLTDNAMKFTPEGGTIRVSLWKEGPYACVEVSDTGIGIPPQDVERVFLEFYQVANTERDRSRGLGLGLSIVQRLCRILNIRLSLNSTLGEGTSIRLTLPALDENTIPLPTGTGGRIEVRPGLRVLVVDDEDMVRQSMRMLLVQMGCQVFLAEGTPEALAIAQAHALDVVISDHRLREGDSGPQAIRAVKALHPRSVAALVTGDTAPDRIQDAQKAGVPLLHKPLSVDQLVGLLQSVDRQP